MNFCPETGMACISAGAITLSQRAAELVKQHGGLRRAARAIGIDAPYLSRLYSGDKDQPSARVLRKMGLQRVVIYKRRSDIGEKR